MPISASFRKNVDVICAELPGAKASDLQNGEHDAWRIDDRMFACFSGATHGISVKTADIETAEMLIEAGVALRAPYFHKSWVRLPEDVTTEELRHRLEVSYDLVRAGLTKKAQAALPPRA